MKSPFPYTGPYVNLLQLFYSAQPLETASFFKKLPSNRTSEKQRFIYLLESKKNSVQAGEPGTCTNIVRHKKTIKLNGKTVDQFFTLDSDSGVS